MLSEEKRKSEAAEVRMKLVDEPSINDDKKLKQHEKDITQQEASDLLLIFFSFIFFLYFLSDSICILKIVLCSMSFWLEI